MAIKNMIIIKNRFLSWSLRGGILLLLIFSALMTATVSLQYLYQESVDAFFSGTPTPNEDILIIHTGNNWITASGENKSIYQPLLSDELGAYQSHRYVGWYADYKQWKKGLQLPFTLVYEVTYDKAVISENFHFTGGFPTHLLAREVALGSEIKL